MRARPRGQAQFQHFPVISENYLHAVVSDLCKHVLRLTQRLDPRLNLSAFAGHDLRATMRKHRPRHPFLVAPADLRPDRSMPHESLAAFANH